MTELLHFHFSLSCIGEGNGNPLQCSLFLPGESQGWGSLESCSPWGHWGSDLTERLHFHFSLSCIREGNGNPLQCSCLENPRDGGAWWAAVYALAQSETRLKWLSSSSSRIGRNVTEVTEDSETNHLTGHWPMNCLTKSIIYFKTLV